jgi:hypothetical protein
LTLDGASLSAAGAIDVTGALVVTLGPARLRNPLSVVESVVYIGVDETSSTALVSEYAAQVSVQETAS